MKNLPQYLFFFAVVLLSQIMLFNNLTFSAYLAPLVYIVCIIMMPLGTSPLKMIIVGIVLGAIMDVTMGTAGLNVIATLPVAYFRRSLLSLVASYADMDGEGDTPSQLRIPRFHNYVVAMVLLHNIIFFGVENMTIDNFWFIALRWLCSTTVTMAVVYLFIAIFTPKLTRR